jgi:CXXX repeat peptide maturase
LRVSKNFLFSDVESIRKILKKTERLNIFLCDIDSFNEEDFNKYDYILKILAKEVGTQYKLGNMCQLNILTDRLFLTKMNNCGAGDTVVTLAPNGKFYTCPAFYYEDKTENIGNLEQGMNIKNAQLYKIDNAPICRHCEAWHCNRCIWLNRKTTLEVNTPSREQCTVSHIERNASKDLLERLCEQGFKFPNNCIPEIDYSDPFENRELWQQENL